MLKNYLKTAYRNIIREKYYTMTNIVGLAVGIACCVLILLFINHESSYDNYHTKADRLYRLYIDGKFGDNLIGSSKTSAPIKDAFEHEIAEIEQVTRLMESIRPVVRKDEDSFIEENFFYADSNFFSTFTVEVIEGNPKTVLSKPNCMVITREMAKKYFGDENPIGKSLTVNSYEIEITGITEKMPSNSHFQYNFLASLTTMGVDSWQSWLTSNLYTYVLLKPGVNPNDIYPKFHNMAYKYVGPEVQQAMGIDLETFEKMGNSYGFFLEAVPDIHLYSNLDHQISAGGNIAYIYFFSTIALFILAIACINYMNLATAKYSNRAKEVGIRKVVGSGRKKLIIQFLFESIIVCLIAVLIAMTAIEIVLPQFNYLTGKDLSLSYFDNWFILPAFIVFGTFVGILSGIYPAFFMSSFKPIVVLKGQLNSSMSSSQFRGVLVVVQFAITIALFVSTFVVTQQLNFFKSKDLGFSKEGVVVLKRTHTLGDKYGAFREELLSSPDIIDASFCDALPGYSYNGTTVSVEGKPSEEMVQTGIVRADENYIHTLGIQLVDGRYLSSNFSTDRESIVINQKMASMAGLSEPLGKRLLIPYFNGDKVTPGTIVGVMPDIYFESLHKETKPMVYALSSGADWLMAIRFRKDNITNSLKHIESKWKEFNPNQPFLYSFLNSDLEKLYKEEERTSKIFSLFSILAIFIACLGLLGMASFAAEKRTKEIGVRKVLGAENKSIFILLSKQVIMLVIYAALFASPIAWFVMKNWLNNFAHRIDIAPWMFFASIFIAFAIALLTISYQAIKAATANPIRSLKYE
ncbi:MAG: ABC transporter permease [Tenuifilaceae bacterium]|jgi:putative ABC transport system permease protein|nr:ABC transporter permease [Tenuifilaceae bacterium]